MNRRMMMLTASGLLLIAVAAGVLSGAGHRQRLSPPGVRTHALPNTQLLEADLPEKVANYESEKREVEDVTKSTLPQDTSFGVRQYTAADGFKMVLRVVLMGRDRTSMHKPQICLTGQGWQIDDSISSATTIHVTKPIAYDLPVVKLVARAPDAQNRLHTGIYVYWYVANDAVSASTSGFQRMWLMASKLLKTGVLQRWAYVSCFSECAPGEEAATFERMSRFLAEAVPQFQLYPMAQANTVMAAQ
jgi:hypothetical protein